MRVLAGLGVLTPRREIPCLANSNNYPPLGAHDRTALRTASRARKGSPSHGVRRAGHRPSHRQGSTTRHGRARAGGAARAIVGKRTVITKGTRAVMTYGCPTTRRHWLCMGRTDATRSHYNEGHCTCMGELDVARMHVQSAGYPRAARARMHVQSAGYPSRLHAPTRKSRHPETRPCTSLSLQERPGGASGYQDALLLSGYPTPIPRHPPLTALETTVRYGTVVDTGPRDRGSLGDR
jgi:hypothetical protein